MKTEVKVIHMLDQLREKARGLRISGALNVYLHHDAWLKHTRCGREVNQTILALKTLLKYKMMFALFQKFLENDI